MSAGSVHLATPPTSCASVPQDGHVASVLTAAAAAAVAGLPCRPASCWPEGSALACNWHAWSLCMRADSACAWLRSMVQACTVAAPVRCRAEHVGCILSLCLGPSHAHAIRASQAVCSCTATHTCELCQALGQHWPAQRATSHHAANTTKLCLAMSGQ
jgi:hypothetical protein